MAPISVGGRLNAIAPTQELVDSYLMLNGKKPGEAGSGYDENSPYVGRDPRLTNTVVYHLYQWKNQGNSLKTIYTKPNTDPDADPQILMNMHRVAHHRQQVIIHVNTLIQHQMLPTLARA
jgi:hypothetical protein